MPKEPRPYQTASVQSLFDWLFTKPSKGNPLIVSPVGSGKALINAMVINEIHKLYPRTRILCVTHVKELLTQNADELRDFYPDADYGFYCASLGIKRLHNDITFASIQSIYNKAHNLNRAPEVILIDECFAGDTLINTNSGPKRIDKVSPGDIVYNATGMGEVLAVSKKQTNVIYRIKLNDGSEIRCTGNHPILSEHGWTTARELGPGQQLFSIQNMPELWEKLSSVQNDGEKSRENDGKATIEKSIFKTKVLFDILLEEDGKCNVDSRRKRENVENIKKNRAQAINSWWQWSRAYKSTEKNDGNSWERVGCRVTNKNIGRSQERNIPQCIQGGLGKSKVNVSYRDRWNEPQRETENFGSKERQSSFVVRVESVEIEECRGGEYIYNLQVSGHPSYFANGILVHNCHLISHDENTQYRKFIDECKKLNPNLVVIGLTGTPFRADSGLIYEGEGALFDGICYEIEISWMIDQGYLVKPVTPPVKTIMNVDGVKTSKGDYILRQLEKAVDVDEITQACVAEIMELTQDRNKVLIFTAGVEHCTHVRDAIRAYGVTCEMVTGDTPKTERDEILRRYAAGEFKYLVNVAVLCLDEKTEILTSDGFVGIDDMTYDHKIAAWKEDGGVEFTKPENIVRRERFDDEEMVSSENGISANIRVTSNHRMVIRCGGQDKNIKVVPAINLEGISCSIPAYGDCEPEKIYIETPKRKQNEDQQIRSTSFSLRKRGYLKKDSLEMSIKQVKKLRSMKHASPHELTIDECKLIGFWLGDGSKSCGRVVISQSMRYKDNVEWFDGILKSTGIHHSRNIRKKKGKLTNDVVLWSLARGTGGYNQSVEKGYFYIEPYLEKDGTFLFKHLNKNQLLALLEGFWRADGRHHSKKKVNRITGCQYKLYDILQSVCVVRGISASISKPIKPRKYNHNIQWSFSWGGRKNWSYTKKSIVKEKSWKKERVWCVTSSTSFLICRRNGKVFVTGNTTGYNVPSIDCIVLMRPMKSPVLYIQTLGRGIRTVYADGYDLTTQQGRLDAIANSIKPDCRVLDFGGVVKYLGPIDAIKITRKNSGKKDKDAPPGDAIMKRCPACGFECFAAQRYCYNCSYNFLQESLSPTADKGSYLLSADEPPRIVSVLSMTVSRHIKKHKEGDPIPKPTMKVTYGTFEGSYSDFICFEHHGYPRDKAVSWFRQNLPSHVIPKDVKEGLLYKDFYRIPSDIEIKREGKYWRVSKVFYKEKDTHKEQAIEIIKDYAVDDKNELIEIPW